MSRALVLALVALLAVAIAAACGGGGGGAPVPGIAAVTAERDLRENAALRTSTITVRFDRNFTLAERTVPLASLFEIEIAGVAAGSSGTRRVFVRQAAVSTTNGRIIELQVDALVPDGATLRVRREAFRRQEPGDLTAPITSDLSEAAVVLASAAFAPQRAELFEQAATAPPPGPGDRDPAAQRAALEANLASRGASNQVVRDALNAYDAMPVAVVPSAKLRAALAALTGTFAQPAIEALLTAQNCTGQPAAAILFQVPPENPELFARVTYTRDGARVLSFRPDLEAEPLGRLMPLLAHEAIHCDQEDGRWEEIAATAFDTFLFMQLVAADPAVVEGGSALARELNVDAVAMFNSGRRYPESAGILPSEGVARALPLTNSPAASFAELIAAAYTGITTNTSPTEALAQRYAEALAVASGMAAGSAFNLVYLDQLIGRATEPATLAAVYVAFDLAPVR